MKKSKSKSQISIKELSALVNLGQRQLYMLAMEGRIPKSEDGMFPFHETITAICKYYQRDPEELKRERLLLVKAQRQQKELDLAASEGKFIDRGQAIQDFQGCFRRFHILVRTELEKHSTADLRNELTRLNCPAPIVAAFYQFAVNRAQQIVDAIEASAAKEAKTEPNQ